MLGATTPGVGSRAAATAPSHRLIGAMARPFSLSSPAWVVILFLIAVAWRVAWAWLIPHDQAPDEPAHLRIVGFLLRERHLPTLAESGPATTGYYAAISPLPYLPYVLVGGLFSLQPDQDLLALRSLSALMGGLVIVVAALNSRILFRHEPYLAIGIPAFMAIHPQFAFLNSYVNGDAVTILVSSILVLWWTKLWFEGPSWKNTVIVALIVGLLALTKTNSLALLPATGLLWAWTAYRAKLQAGEAVARVSVALLLVVAMAGWHYVRIWFEFHDLTGARTATRIGQEQWPDWAPTALAATPGDVLRFLRTSFIAWWAFFGNLQHILPRPVYVGLGLLVLTSAFGLLRIARRRVRLEVPVGLLVVYSGAFLTIVTMTVVFAFTDYIPANGKYWYPAIIPSVSLVFAGYAALPVGGSRAWSMLLLTFAVSLAFWSYFGLLWPLYR